jgi:alkanesulfonate monooxygenase SsuD/methylene tetrahydromethanopterin reductase-like flavin-dependent oxidoreductase (luciferase family)
VTHRVSFTIPQFAKNPQLALELASSGAALGLTGIFAFDHLVPLGDPSRPVLEGAATLGALAAATTDLRVGSLVTRVTLRSPSITAAVGAALSAISPGRSVLGLGAGDSMSEAEAIRYGMDRPDLATRIAILEETIEELRASAPALPVWVGGRHRRIRHVAATRADGWNAWGASVDDFAMEAQEVREGAGRSITVSWGGGVVLVPDQESLDSEIAARGGTEALARSGMIAGTAPRLVESLGVLGALADELVVSVLPNTPENWTRFSQEVLPHL